MAHQRNSKTHATANLDGGSAREVARILQGLANPSRVQLLNELREGPLTVGELTDALGLEQSAVSHQLRHLRDLGFVLAERHGRHMAYQLFDDHVGDLLDQALSHAEHLRLAAKDATQTTGREVLAERI